MDALIAFLLVVVAVMLFRQKPVKIEVTHKHIIESEPAQTPIMQDPNDTSKMDPEVEKSMNTVIQSINAIMNGGEFPDGER